MALHSGSRLLTAWSILLSTALVSSGCDRGNTASESAAGDPVWQRDSTLLAKRPALLLRVVRDTAPGRAPVRAIPVATLGEDGFRALSMGDRGFRALDLAYLQGGQTLTPYRFGDRATAVPIDRGMWEGAPLDTVARCSAIAPSAALRVGAEVDLLVAGPAPGTTAVPELPESERARIVENVLTLVAPTAGVSMTQAASYRREVYTAATRAHDTRTLVVVLTSPDRSRDTTVVMGQRPRQLIVVLDQGVYGYKPSYVFRDISDTQTLPQRRYLGHLDADGDGVSELFFGLADPRFPLVTYALRHENDTWRDWWRYERASCHAARN